MSSNNDYQVTVGAGGINTPNTDQTQSTESKFGNGNDSSISGPDISTFTAGGGGHGGMGGAATSPSPATAKSGGNLRDRDWETDESFPLPNFDSVD